MIASAPLERRHRLALAVRALCALAALSACDAVEAPPGRLDDPSITSVEIALQQGPTVAFEVGLDLMYCAATVRCEPELLTNPFNGRRSTTLVLAYTCRADGRSEAFAALDVFQSIQRRMTCYDEGDPADPTTWLPAAGHTVVPLREESYAGLVNVMGDTQYHLAVLPLDAVGHAFCRIEAWGVFDSAPLAAGDRAVSHSSHAPVTYWDVFVDGPTPETLDCHLKTGDVSGLQVGHAVSVTHTRPSPIAAGRYPRRQSFAIALGARHHMDSDGVEAVVHGLRVAYGVDADFPTSVTASTGDLQTRDVWFADPANGAPRDVTVGASCPLVSATGELEGIALQIIDWWVRVPIGALVLHDTLGAERFECEHDPESSACRLIAPEDIALEAPCLVDR